MSQPAPKSVPKYRFCRLFCVYLIIGAVGGCLSGMTERVLGVPHAAVVFVSIGLLVGVAPVLNWLARLGELSWLIRDFDDWQGDFRPRNGLSDGTDIP